MLWGRYTDDAGRAGRRQGVPRLVQNRTYDGQAKRVAVRNDEIGNDLK